MVEKTIDLRAFLALRQLRRLAEGGGNLLQRQPREFSISDIFSFFMSPFLSNRAFP